MPVIAKAIKWTERDAERFWRLAEGREREDGCWEWQGHRAKKGYGVFEVQAMKWGRVRAHRFAWAVTNGDIPGHIRVCHHCDNPGCVNPKHLFLGTDRDNIYDSMKKGRWDHLNGGRKYRVGALVPTAKLNEEQVREIRRLYGAKMKQREIAMRYGITGANVSMIVQGKSWAHVK